MTFPKRTPLPAKTYGPFFLSPGLAPLLAPILHSFTLPRSDPHHQTLWSLFHNSAINHQYLSKEDALSDLTALAAVLNAHSLRLQPHDPIPYAATQLLAAWIAPLPAFLRVPHAAQLRSMLHIFKPQPRPRDAHGHFLPHRREDLWKFLCAHGAPEAPKTPPAKPPRTPGPLPFTLDELHGVLSGRLLPADVVLAILDTLRRAQKKSPSGKTIPEELFHVTHAKV